MPIVVATLLAGIVSASATAGYGAIKRRRDERRADENSAVEVAAYIDGIPAVPGVTDGVPSAALRTQRLERTVAEVVQGQSLLEKRMDEANGTGRRTEAMVREIRDHLGMATN